MGFVDAQKEKADRRIRDALEGRLEAGEQVTSALVAVNRTSWWPALFLFPVFFYFEFIGKDVPSGFIGGTVALAILVFMRSFYVVLTDRRLLVLRLTPLSSKRVAGEHAVPRDQARATYKEGMLNGILGLEAGTESYNLQIARPLRDRGAELASQLGGPGA